MAQSSTNYRRAAALGLFFSLLLVFGVSWFSHQASRDLLDSFRGIFRAQRIERGIHQILGQTAAAEDAQRGLLLTRKTRYLEPFAAARAEFPAQFAQLKQLVPDAPQKQKVEQLERLIEQRLALAEKTISLAQSGKTAEAIAIVETDEGQDMMDEIRRHAAHITADEDAEMALHNTHLLRQTRRYQWAASAIAAVHLAFLILVAILLWRLTRIHDYLTICAWSNTVEYEGEWISFEEYLHRRFDIDVSHGLNPREAERLLAKSRTRPSA